MPKVGMHPIRREQLIQATIVTIDELGLADATMARIARAAGLSTGIISHYFDGKSDLLEATMRHLLRQLGEAVIRFRREAPDHSARSHLRAIVDGNFDASQTSRASMRVWLAFWSSSMHVPSLERLQQVNDRRLYSNICWEFRRSLPVEEARFAATGLAAMIDGLWLRGSLSHEDIDVQRARCIAYAYIDHQLNAHT